MPRKKTGTRPRSPKKPVTHPPATSSPTIAPLTPKSGEPSLKIVDSLTSPDSPTIEERAQIVEAEGEVKGLRYPELTAMVVVELAKIRTDRHPILSLVASGVPNWKKVPDMWVRIMTVAEAKAKTVTWVDNTIHMAVQPEPILAHSRSHLVRFVAIAAGMEGLVLEIYRGLHETVQEAHAELDVKLEKGLVPQEKADA